jgi:hypothetical protein
MLSSGKRLIWRGFYYMRAGASVLGFAFTFLTFITVTYDNLSFVSNFFGGFIQFALVTSGFVAVGLALFGHYWLKKSRFYKEEIEVGVEANPYQNCKVSPNGVPFWEAMVQLMEKEGIPCEDAKEMLRNSGSKVYKKVQPC